MAAAAPQLGVEQGADAWIGQGAGVHVGRRRTGGMAPEPEDLNPRRQLTPGDDDIGAAAFARRTTGAIPACAARVSAQAPVPSMAAPATAARRVRTSTNSPSTRTANW